MSESVIFCDIKNDTSQGLLLAKMDSLILYPFEESTCETFTAAIQDLPSANTHQ